MGYNPDLPDERIKGMLNFRFPEVDGNKLFTAWQEASMIYPTTTGFHWGPLDFQWYIEGCKSRKEFAQNETGFHDVNRFISLQPHPRSGFQSIPDYVKMTVSGGSSELKNPGDVSQILHDHSARALALLKEMNAGNNKELALTMHDIKTMAWLGKYYACKIAGAAQLALYREIKDKSYQENAIAELEEALKFWVLYTETAMQQNINPIWTNRVGYVDWIKITEWVKQDIEIARNE
jgi:hypothetical protein